MSLGLLYVTLYFFKNDLVRIYCVLGPFLGALYMLTHLILSAALGTMFSLYPHFKLGHRTMWGWRREVCSCRVCRGDRERDAGVLLMSLSLSRPWGPYSLILCLLPTFPLTWEHSTLLSVLWGQWQGHHWKSSPLSVHLPVPENKSEWWHWGNCK